MSARLAQLGEHRPRMSGECLTEDRGRDAPRATLIQWNTQNRLEIVQTPSRYRLRHVQRRGRPDDATLPSQGIDEN